MTAEHTARQPEIRSGGNPPLDRMLFHSFRISQGEVPIQIQLFQWLKKRGELEGYDLSQREMPDAVAAIRPKGRHGAIDETTAQGFIRQVWMNLQMVDSGVLPVPDDLVQSLFQGYLRRDQQFRNGGRPVEDVTKEHPPAPPDSLEDRSASWLRRYVLHGRRTGVPGFDALHSEMRPLLLEEMRRAESIVGFSTDPDVTLTSYHLRGVMDDWERAHLGEVFISPEIREEMEQMQPPNSEVDSHEVFQAADASAGFGRDDVTLSKRQEARDTRPPLRTRQVKSR